MTEKTLYEILGVAPAATAAEIRTAYRLLAMKSHPAHGRGTEASERFAEVTSAYAVLSSVEGRRQYDEQIQTVGRVGANERISQTEAERMFAKEMSALAWELSDAGYRKDFIEQALAEEGCPAGLAMTAASGTVLALGEGRDVQAVVEPQFAIERSDRAPRTFDVPSSRTPSRARPNRWLPIGVVLLVCVLAYSFVYRPYVAAKEEEARRVVAERELAAATAARLAAEERARAAEQRQEDERIRKEERIAELALADRRQRAMEAAARADLATERQRQQINAAASQQARLAEYQACLSRLRAVEPVANPQYAPGYETRPTGPIPGMAGNYRPPGAAGGAGHFGSSIAESTGQLAGAIVRYKGEQYNDSVRLRAQQICQDILRR